MYWVVPAPEQDVSEGEQVAVTSGSPPYSVELSLYWLREELKLELNEEKTLITHARTQPATYLGYEIIVQHSRTRPQANGVVRLRVPQSVIKAKCAPFLKHGKPERRTELMNFDDHTIISMYGAEYRGIVQYYLPAADVYRLNRLQWVAKTSMLKTLAARHRSTVTKMAAKYKATTATPHGPRTCFEARVERAGRKPLVARFGGIPLKRQKKAVLTDRQPAPAARRKELITRLQAGRCEWCGKRADAEVHQVRKLADLARTGRPQPAWAQLMATMRRKDPPGLHHLPPGHPREATNRGTHGVVTGELRAGKLARVVRTGGRWKRTCTRQAPRQRPTGVPLVNAEPARSMRRARASCRAWHR
jgi:hypothetical protein